MAIILSQARAHASYGVSLTGNCFAEKWHNGLALPVNLSHTLHSVRRVSTVDKQETVHGEELLDVVTNMHREQSAMSQEAPIAEWETLRLKPFLELPQGKGSGLHALL